jgi:hypothetical protein
VAGGLGNNATNARATICGGTDNTASGDPSAIGGGISNIASGHRTTVPGGYHNTAGGEYSFAAGRRAKIAAAHDGAFLFADSNDDNFNSATADEFAVRCTGGARFVTAIDGSNPTQTMALSSSGYLGVGTTSPARSIHLQGSNACFRMDRDADSSAFILVRTASGDFNTIWKTFYVGVDASGVNNGEFFIGDVGNNVSGPSTKRLWIDNSGQVHIPNLGTGDITLANDFVVTEDEKAGVAFKNDSGEKIAVLDREGNFHIKGKVMEDL